MISKTLRRIRVGAFGVAASLIAACGSGGGDGGTTGPGGGSPAAVTVISSPPASAPTGTTISTPLTVIVNDAKGKAVSSIVVAFKVTAGNGTLSAGAATTDANGQAGTTFTLGSSAGTNEVTASVTGLAATAKFSINGIPTSTCTTPTAVAVGEVVTGAAVTNICLGATASQDYTVMVVGMSPTAAAKTSFELVGNSIGGSPGLFSRAVPDYSGGLSLGAPPRPRNDAAEVAVIARQLRETAPLMSAARSWYASRQSARGAARFDAIPVTAKVGDVYTLNVNGSSGCGPGGSPLNRPTTVRAVGNTVIILEDNANPPSDFGPADFQSVADNFDLFVDPLDRAAFGDVTDIDGNHKVIVLYTSTINAMNPAKATGFVGGLTAPRDLYTVAQCPNSNFGEMFYMLAADTGGVVNGNKVTKAYVANAARGTMAHEYQHLINFSRRLYVNGNVPQEEVWLNEGLSHEAEELMYFKVSASTPRTNQGGAGTIDQNQANIFLLEFVADFGRYDEYMSHTYDSSPYMPDDSLATRGATQFFLRYAADRVAASDGNIWFKLANGPAVGRANLRAAYGVDDATLQAMFRDFAISVWADDAVGLTVDPKYTQLSWNIRAIYPRLTFTDGSHPTFPLIDATTISVERAMADGVPIPLTLNGGSFGVFRMSTAAGVNATVRLTGSGGGGLPVGAQLTLAIIRTR